MVTNRRVNVLGFIKSVGDTIQGNANCRRHLMIADDSKLSIQVTLWGEKLCNQAGSFRIGEIIALVDVSVSQFGGKSLNASDHCKLI